MVNDLGPLVREPALKGSHLPPRVRGDLLHRLSRYEEARAAFEASAALAGNRRKHDVLRQGAAEANDAAMSSQSGAGQKKSSG